VVGGRVSREPGDSPGGAGSATSRDDRECKFLTRQRQEKRRNEPIERREWAIKPHEVQKCSPSLDLHQKKKGGGKERQIHKQLAIKRVSPSLSAAFFSWLFADMAFTGGHHEQESLQA